MNRSIAAVGLAVVFAGIGLVALPIAVLGHEQFEVEQVAGLLLAPVGLFVVMIAVASADPRRTTVTGRFGNPEEAVPAPLSGAARGARPRFRSPHAPVHCRYCRSVITADLSACPRCARARACRSCGRPLGQVLDRPTCPRCARAEAFCNCALLARPQRS